MPQSSRPSLPLPVAVPTSPQGTPCARAARLAALLAGFATIGWAEDIDIRQRSNLRTEITALGVAHRDGLCLVADGNGGLQVVEVADPDQPRRIGALPTPGPARSVLLAGPLAYVAADAAGVVVVDIGDPANPRQVGAFDTAGIAVGLALDGDRLHVADGPAGVVMWPAASSTAGAHSALLCSARPQSAPSQFISTNFVAFQSLLQKLR